MTHRGPFQPLPFCDFVVTSPIHIILIPFKSFVFSYYTCIHGAASANARRVAVGIPCPPAVISPSAFWKPPGTAGTHVRRISPAETNWSSQAAWKLSPYPWVNIGETHQGEDLVCLGEKGTSGFLGFAGVRDVHNHIQKPSLSKSPLWKRGVRFPFWSQNHRMVGVGRDLCGSSSPTPAEEGHLQQAAQDLVLILSTKAAGWVSCVPRPVAMSWVLIE